MADYNVTEQEYQELEMRERYDDPPLTPAEKFLLGKERQRRGALTGDVAALEGRQADGEHLNALEAFMLRKEKARQSAPLNRLEEIAAAWRRGPWAERE